MVRILFWLGVLVIVAGVVSFFVPIPGWQTHGVGAFGISRGAQNFVAHIPPLASAVIVLTGVVLTLAGGRR